MMGRIINKIAGIFGVRISRVKKKEKPRFKEFDKPLLIEFIGVSGVGKSTLYAQLDLKMKNWISIKEYLKYNNSEKNDLWVDELSLYQQFANINFSSICKSKMLSFDKFRIASYRYGLLRKDIVIYLRKDNAVVITDDGLVHNSNSAFIELYKESPSLFMELLKNKCFIYCYTNPERLGKQIVKRYEERGFMAPQHKNKSLEELIEIQDSLMKEREKLLGIFEKEKIPVLRVDTSDNAEINVKKIYDFVDALL